MGCRTVQNSFGVIVWAAVAVVVIAACSSGEQDRPGDAGPTRSETQSGNTGATTDLTLGEKLFSEVVGNWGGGLGGLDYRADSAEIRADAVHEINVLETIEGITVAVDRAYFYSNKVGIEYTVTGLPQSPSEDTREYEPWAELRDDRANRMFPMAGGSGVRAGSPLDGMEVPPGTVKEVIAVDVADVQADASGMRLRFTVNVDESMRDADSPERVIGPYVFRLELPFVPNTATQESSR